MQDQLKAAEAELQAAGLKLRALFDIHLSTGTYIGWWHDADDFAYNHGDGTGLITYRGRHGLSRVEPYVAKVGLEVMSLEVAITGLSTPAQTMATDKTWRQRPVRWWIAIFDAQTGAVVQMARRFTGFADDLTWSEQPGGEASIVLRCESRAREYGRATDRYRTHADQQSLIAHVAAQFTSGEDKGFEFVGVADKTPITWGKAGKQYIGKQKTASPSTVRANRWAKG